MKELIVLVDDSGKPTGTADKLSSHHANTPLHLAFSCFLFNESGEFLLTRRALSKKVWPGVWTGSVCGHPAPGETMIKAIKRRTKFELGIMAVEKLKVILPEYRYKTPPFKGIVENEVCPLYIGRVGSEPKLNPKEVEDYRWVQFTDVLQEIEEIPSQYSYWFKDQLLNLRGVSNIINAYD